MNENNGNRQMRNMQMNQNPNYNPNPVIVKNGMKGNKQLYCIQFHHKKIKNSVDLNVLKEYEFDLLKIDMKFLSNFEGNNLKVHIGNFFGAEVGASSLYVLVSKGTMI